MSPSPSPSPSPSWEEALDVDDSLALLRPCKQQQQQQRRLDKTLDSSNLHSLQPIPGPAGIVQVAKLRKAHEPPMSTQEYIRRAVEDPEEDADFNRNPWLSAVQFISGHASMSHCAVPSAPLGYVKKFLKNGKLDQVVAVIKSSAPNGLGDLLVMLKDPTGMISGTIHHKVLIDEEFGKDISVGSVLILHKVSVFSPTLSANYLNITVRNLVKVFREDSEPSLKQTSHRCTIKDAAAYGSGGCKIGPYQKLTQAKEADVIEICEIEEVNGNKKKVEGRDAVEIIEPVMVSALLLPHWTDEQLNELFDDL